MTTPPEGAQPASRPLRFAHLHQHTQYSLLDGAAKLKPLLQWVKDVTPDRPACAITDHGNMHGAVHFHNYALELGVKPILGLEAYVTDGDRREQGRPYHLTLLAQNMEGYRNLCRLTSESYMTGFYKKPRIDHALLTEHNAGIICLSGCIACEVAQLILSDREDEAFTRMSWYARTFKDRYYVEIQRHVDEHAVDPSAVELRGLQAKVNAVLKDFAGRLGLGMVATNDGHYIQKGDARAHDALLAIQTGAVLSDEKRLRFSCDEFYVKTPEQLRELLPASEFSDELFTNAAEIADRCEDGYLPVGKKRVYQLPSLPTPAGLTPAETLRVQTYHGLMHRYAAVTPALFTEYLKGSWKAESPDERQALIARVGRAQPDDLESQLRMIAALSSVTEAGCAARSERVSTYPALLTLPEGEGRDLLKRAEYELGVINRMDFPDYFLIVADYIRWAKSQGIAVGPGRGSGAGSIVAYANLITDLDPIHFKLLFERFLNPDRVNMPDFDIDFDDVRRGEVITYIREKYGDDRVAQISIFQSLQARAAFKDVARVMGVDYNRSKAVTKLIPVKFGKSASLKETTEIPEIASMYARDPQLTQVRLLAEQLEGLAKAPGTHPAGLVIGREPLENLIPLMRDAKGGGVVSQFDMKSVEDIGLVKMDLLGLRTLSFIAAAETILRAQGVTIDLMRLPEDDRKTMQMLGEGDTKGVFQLESSGITQATRSMKPRHLNDIIAIGALYRPGPMENIPTYIRRHHGEEPVSYEQFPASAALLAPILDSTYGIPVYQEQIMQIASDVAGFSLGEADLLRRAMGKKDLAEMERQKKIFAEKSQARGIPDDEARRLFEMLEKFANYGFNLSHAAAYGLISYQTAFLKAHHRVAFMAALLSVELEKPEKVAEYVSDARSSGIEVLPPDVTTSGAKFTIEGNHIRFGLMAIRGISAETAEAIIAERGSRVFRSLQDFMERFSTKVRKKDVLEALIRAGAMDSFGERGLLLGNLERLLKAAKKADEQKKKNLSTLFGGEQAPDEALVPCMSLTPGERLTLEKLSMGLYISGHPLEHHPVLRSGRTVPISELDALLDRLQPERDRLNVVVAGVIEEVTVRPQKDKRSMAKLTISDETGSLEVVAFAGAYESVSEKLVKGEVRLFSLSARTTDDERSLSVSGVVSDVDLDDLNVPMAMYLNIDLDVNPAAAELAAELATKRRGSHRLQVRLQQDGYVVSISTKSRVSPSAQLEFQALPGVDAQMRLDDEEIIKVSKPKREGNWVPRAR